MVHILLNCIICHVTTTTWYLIGVLCDGFMPMLTLEELQIEQQLVVWYKTQVWKSGKKRAMTEWDQNWNFWPKCVSEITHLHNVNKFPRWNMVAASACNDDTILQQRQRSWSMLMGKWKEIIINIHVSFLKLLTWKKIQHISSSSSDVLFTEGMATDGARVRSGAAGL